MSQNLAGKFGRVSEYPLFNPFGGNDTGVVLAEYNGGGSSGGGGIYTEPPLVTVEDFPQEYVTTNITDTAIIKPLTSGTPKAGDTLPIDVAKVTPITVNQFGFEQIKQTIKNNPVIALAVVGVVGYLVFRKGGK